MEVEKLNKLHTVDMYTDRFKIYTVHENSRSEVYHTHTYHGKERVYKEKAPQITSPALLQE